MIIECLGDSITEGFGVSAYSKCYVVLLRKMLGAEVINHGICATRIAKQKIATEDERGERDFLSRVDDLSPNADFVFVFGGTNDYGHGDALMGEEEGLDPYTFNGALNELMGKLTKRYGANKVAFILPLWRYQEESLLGDGRKRIQKYTLEDYRKAIESRCKAHGVFCLDLRPVLPKPSGFEADAYYIDGLHPNDTGHRIIASSLYGFLKGKESLSQEKSENGFGQK